MNIKDLIEVNPKKMSGVPVFKGTRVPITHLFEYLEKGETLTEFLRQFPSVTHDQALAVLNSQKSLSSQIMKLLLDECVVRDLKRDLVLIRVICAICGLLA